MKALLTTLLLASTTLTAVAHAEPMSNDDKSALDQILSKSQGQLDFILNGSDEERAKLPSEAKIREDAAACSAAAAAALAKHADPTTTFDFIFDESGKIVMKHITLEHVDEQICRVVAEKSVGLDERRAKVAAAAIEAKLGPYKKLGVAGDKLALLDKFWTEVLGPNEADPTPQVVAKSSVLFRLIKDDDWNYTLIRYVFRGNKQVRATTQTFHSDPPASSYR